MEPELSPLLSACRLRRVYGKSNAPIAAVNDVSLELAGPGLYAIVGRSGSGKSTLLNLLAGLDRPTSGDVAYRGTSLSGLRERRLSHVRRDEFGFVFQRFNLIPTLTGRANITLPTVLSGRPVDDDHVAELIDRLHIDRRVLRSLPDEMSGGQQQRIAVARALAHRPRVVFADEPTGNLDTNNSVATVTLLREIADDLGTCVVVVTHEPAVAAAADVTFTIRDGTIAERNQSGSSPLSVVDRSGVDLGVARRVVAGE